jgi:hypothetical protein
MWRPLVALALVGFTGFSVGATASLAQGTDSLGAASVDVPRCTSAGVDVFQNLASGNITSVTVSGLPGSCGGATIKVTVDNGSTTASGSTSVPGGAGSVTVTLAGTIAATTTERTDIVLMGP